MSKFIIIESTEQLNFLLECAVNGLSGKECIEITNRRYPPSQDADEVITRSFDGGHIPHEGVDPEVSMDEDGEMYLSYGDDDGEAEWYARRADNGGWSDAQIKSFDRQMARGVDCEDVELDIDDENLFGPDDIWAF